MAELMKITLILSITSALGNVLFRDKQLAGRSSSVAMQLGLPLSHRQTSHQRFVSPAQNQLLRRKTTMKAQLPKDDLLDLVKLRQSPWNRLKVEEAITRLSLATEGKSQFRKPVKGGVWRLLWSSPTSAINPFSTPDLVLLAKTFQVIKGTRGANIVKWGPESDSPRLIGGADLVSVGPGRTRLTVDKFVLKLPGIREIPLFKAPKNSDVLKTLYNDGELRVSQGEDTKIQYIHEYVSGKDATMKDLVEDLYFVS